MSLIYNGVPLVYGQTDHHIMGPEKDPSGTDQLLTVIKLRTRCLLYINSASPSGVPQLPPAIAGTDFNVGQLIARIRHLLTTPRRPLYYDFISLPGTTSGLPASAIINLPDGLDDGNGPWPDEDAISVTYTTADCLEITWGCTVKLRDCGFGVTNGPISLRWEDSLTWDKYFAATYSRVGSMIISSRSALKVDDIRRDTIAPRVAPGFWRQKSSYTCSRDGLRCDFSFTDVQIRHAPPYPAVDMEIVQSETWPLPGGLRLGEVAVAMNGVQNANPRELMFWAMTVAYARVFAGNPLSSSKGQVVGGQSVPVVRCRETNTGIDVSVVVPYKCAVKKKQEKQASATGVFWGGIFGAAIGGPVGSIIGSGIGNLAGGLAAPTQEGRDPTNFPVLPWLGFGTSPATPTNPAGYATWANATGSINGPADGVGLAPAVSLYAAMLQDPCGAALASTPFANSSTAELRTTVNTFNTSLSGSGGTTSVFDSQLSASLSGYNAAQYPNTSTASGDTSLYTFDDEPGVYDLWQCFTEYITDPGVIVIPTCNPTGLNIAIRHSSEMVTIRKRWAATRTGAQPALPPTNPADANLILTGEYVGLLNMEVAPDGVSVKYEVKGVYEYQALDPSKVKKLAEIPPYLSTAELIGQRGWFDGVGELTGAPPGGSGGGGGILNPPV